MAVRVNKLLKEANLGLQTLQDILKALDYKETVVDINTKIPDEIANMVLGICYKDLDLFRLIEENAKKSITYSQEGSKYSLKVVGHIDLDEYNHPNRSNSVIERPVSNTQNVYEGQYAQNPPQYDDNNKGFWIEELWLLSTSNAVNRLSISNFNSPENFPLFSVLIGSNGVGKSSLMREIVDFFIDLHACIGESQPKLSPANKSRIKGVKFRIDGVCCEVVRLEKTYLARIEDKISPLKYLRLPIIVACHFGAFDKFPLQTVNGSVKNKYDVACYKYVGARANTNMISSSAIAFRLLFALAEKMDNRQRQNLTSILDFIGYDHRISLSYSLVMKSKKLNGARSIIQQRVQKDREFCNLSPTERQTKVKELYEFYKTRASSSKTQHYCVLDVDGSSYTVNDDLNTIYKLKQYELVSTTSVIFYKKGQEIASEEMSSGEFAVLSTVISISIAAGDSHSLVLLDEPELSLHPNWQMTLIDNLNRVLKEKLCHILIATHSHMLVSDLPMHQSSVVQLEKNESGDIIAKQISQSTYGWSAEEVLLKVFRTATDRNRYFGERVGKLLEQMSNNTIKPEEVADELKELREISLHLSDVDPMKVILNTIVETYK